MRAWIVLLFLPLAGCLGGSNLSVEASLFALPAITRGDPAPVYVDDCAELLEELNERAFNQALVRLEQSLDDRGYYGFAADNSSGMEASMAPAEDGGASAKDAEVTGTNNQESGVDEADVLKTDGEWTYVLQGQYLFILHSETVGNVTEYHRMNIAGWGGQLLLEPGKDGASDRLLVITQGEVPVESAPMPSEGAATSELVGRMHYGMTRVIVLDLADRSDPEIVHEMWLEGQNVGARLIDGTAYVVVHEHEQYLNLIDYVSSWDVMQDMKMDWDEWRDLPEATQRKYLLREAVDAVGHNQRELDNITLADHIPILLTLEDGQLEPAPISDETCRRFASSPDSTGRDVSSILAIEMGSADYSLNQIFGGRPIVYGATDAIVLAAPSQDHWWFWAQPELEEATNLHWFDLDGLDVSHRASGRVLGIVQDQFGIDVHADQLRVATTTGTWGRWWLEDPDPMANHLVVFAEAAGQLVETGRVGGIAPGERIWSARFTDDRAYIVTFEQIDPLWIIDLSTPVPQILGELEIPGVSTYIHPLDDDTLLTIGYGPGENGLGLAWDRIQVSLFDIRNPADPKRADVLDISPGGEGWSWSGAVAEHKAFTYWAAVGKLAVPMSTHNWGETWSEEDQEWVYESESHVGLRLIDVNREILDLSVYGDVDQNHMLEDGSEYPYYGMDVQRSYFLGYPETGPVSVYAMSGLGVSAHDLYSLEPQDSVAFGINQGYYYW